jgi:hypothetical protein
MWWFPFSAVMGLALASASPVLPFGPRDADARMERLLIHGEELRKISDELRLFRGTEQPPSTTYERVHGGIGP